MTESNEPVEATVVTDEAIQDFLGGQQPTFRPILKIWHEVLKNARTEKDTRVGPAYASRMVQSYPGVTFAMVEEVKDRYFDKTIELLAILEAVIDQADPDALSYGSPEEDREENAENYKNVLLLWQQAVLSWELAWDSNDPFAAGELAAISETHKMFFSETGIVGFLDNIQFQFTEADQQMLADALEEMKASR